MALAFAMADPEALADPGASSTMRDTLSTVINKLIDYNRCTRKRNYSLKYMDHCILNAERESLSERSNEILKYWYANTKVC